jgi:hypothetical protein
MALKGLPELTHYQLRLAAQLHAVCLWLRPSPVRTRINSRSNSARPPKTVNIRRLCGVAVRRGVSPHIAKKPESGLLVGDGGEGIEQVAGRAGQPSRRATLAMSQAMSQVAPLQTSAAGDSGGPYAPEAIPHFSRQISGFPPLSAPPTGFDCQPRTLRAIYLAEDVERRDPSFKPSGIR